MNSGCDRARQWASLELDGELSELERALLGAHLARCGRCSAVVADMRSFTGTLRSASLVPLERPAFAARPAPERRRVAAPVRIAIAATLVALAAGLGAVTGSLSDDSANRAPVATDVALLPASAAESRDVHAQRGVQIVDLDDRRVFPPGRQGGNV